MSGRFPPRIFRRVPFEAELRLRFDDGEEVTARSANVSLGGMFVVVSEPRPVGSTFELSFKLPEQPAPVRGRGRVVWVRPEDDDGSGPVGMGVRFLELTPGSRELIFEVVERRVRDGGSPYDDGEDTGTIADRRPAAGVGSAVASAAAAASGSAPSGEAGVRLRPVTSAADPPPRPASASTAARRPGGGAGAAPAAVPPSERDLESSGWRPAAAPPARPPQAPKLPFDESPPEPALRAPVVPPPAASPPAATTAAAGSSIAEPDPDSSAGTAFSAAAQTSSGWDQEPSAPAETETEAISPPVRPSLPPVEMPVEMPDSPRAPWEMPAAGGHPATGAGYARARRRGGPGRWIAAAVALVAIAACAWWLLRGDDAAVAAGDRPPEAAVAAGDLGGGGDGDLEGGAGPDGGVGEDDPSGTAAGTGGVAAAGDGPAADGVPPGERDGVSDPAGESPADQGAGRSGGAEADGTATDGSGPGAGQPPAPGGRGDAAADRLAGSRAPAGRPPAPASPPAAAPGSPAPAGAPAPEVTPGARSAGPARRVTHITWRQENGATELVIWGDGRFPPGTVRTSILGGDRPRAVLRLIGIGSPFEAGSLDVGTPQVDRVRTGLHLETEPDELHVVIDLANGRVTASEVEEDGERLRLRLEGD